VTNGTARAASIRVHSARDLLLGRQVLLAEDNVVNQKLACRLLERLGAEVTVADTGEAAIEKLSAGSFDVVLMDCQMPLLDGYEATRRIRAGAAGPGAMAVPIIALTAHALSGDRDQCLAAGMNEYLTKPIDPGMLRAKLEGLFRVEFPRARLMDIDDAATESSVVFDDMALRKRIDDDDEFLEELLGAFVGTINEQVVSVLAAATRGEAAAVATHAHAIKGAAASVEANALARAAAALEAKAREGLVDANDVEVLHLAWRETRRHPAVEPFVTKADPAA